jgi:hypothetical protein
MVLKLSQIAAAGAPPSGADQLVGVGGGTNDLLYTPQQLSASFGAAAPNGRLTLTTATPVMTATTTGATIVYFTPFRGYGALVTLDGSNFFVTAFSELSQSTTDTTKSPAAVAANSVYDLFVWSDSGTLRCTRGPAWSSDTSRGTGAGTSELQLIKGIYVNKNTITNGPPAQRGVYVGSIRSNASSQIDFNLGGSASGGTAGFIGIWNNFNRVSCRCLVTDSGASYTYSASATRQARASAGNQVSLLSGQAEDNIRGALDSCEITSGTAFAYYIVGVGLDTTTSTGPFQWQVQPQSATVGFQLNHVQPFVFPPQLGLHYVSSNEVGDGTHTVTYDQNSNNALCVDALY